MLRTVVWVELGYQVLVQVRYRNGWEFQEVCALQPRPNIQWDFQGSRFVLPEHLAKSL